MKATVNQELANAIAKIKFKYSLTQTKIAAEIGVSKQYLSDTVNGRCPFTSELRTKLLTRFPDALSDVSPVTLEAKKELFATNSHGIKFYGSDGNLTMSVPVVPVRALGSPQDEYDALYREYDDEAVSFPVDSVYHGRYLAFMVEGDSMDDGTRRSFQAGDIVLVRELDRDDWMPRLRYDRWPFWVVCFGNSVRIKEIVNQEGDTITLHSLNPSPEYCDFQLQLSDVSRLFNVIQVQPKVQVWK